MTPPQPRQGPCSPWTTETAVMNYPGVKKLCENLDRLDPDLIARMVDVASWVLYERTGRRWAGTCTTTEVVQGPCRCGWSTWRHPCSSHTGPAVRLTRGPVTAVTSVTGPDGTVAPERYRVEDWHWLVMGDADRWPRGELTVEYVHGVAPPAAGQHAAAVLAAELVLAGFPNSGCRLPQRVQAAQRQGIAMAWVDPMQYLTQGLTGLMDVDLFLTSLPKLRTRRSRLVTVDDVPAAHRRG